MLTVGSLFSGIGGLDLGLERAGMRVLWQCESDPYCRAVLRKHWPDVPCHEDIKTLFADSEGQRRGRGIKPRADVEYDGLQPPQFREGVPDVLCGGFPCQPVSLAGRRRGASDERWLWPEFARLIRLLRPRYALMENVPGLLVGGGMAEVLGDLAACGYDAEWDCIPAAAVGAPHLRYRIFIVAYASSSELRDESGWGDGANGQDQAEPRNDGATRLVADSTEHGRQPRRVRDATEEQGGRQPHRGRISSTLAVSGGIGRRTGPGIFRRLGSTRRSWWRTEPDVGRAAHGIPSRVDRLRALGNAVVPQVAEYVGRQIVTAHNRGAA